MPAPLRMVTCATITAMYRWIEHSGEVEFEIDSDSEEGVFREALAALAELLGVEGEGGEKRSIAVSAPDRPSLLATWLEELAVMAEIEGFEPVGIEDLELTRNSLVATIRGRPGDPPPLIKAVTYHRLTFEPTGSGYRATVVLDV